MIASTFTIGAARHPFTTPEAASATYRAYIEARDLGASQSPACNIFDADGKQVGHVSYNGKVWYGTQADWLARNNPQPVFNPYA